ncbi:MAG: class I SAM-dependent methyltransferase [Chloroflexi bacterium]|nr:class I SAM-dependent methyltransferase [Chloroflexota bacterium]
MAHSDKRFDTHRQHVLLDSERLARWDPPRFLARFGLRAGQAVLDLGSGPGFWTLPLAEIVGETGLVWALDVSQELLDVLAARHPPPQVRLLHTELPQITLPDASIDLAWLALVFHEVEPPEQLASELLRVVRDGGLVAILDWRPDAESEAGPPRAHRVRPDQVIARLQAAGFTQAKQTWQDADNYLVQAIKK